MCVFYMHVWWYIFVLDFQICGGVCVVCVVCVWGGVCSYI